MVNVCEDISTYKLYVTLLKDQENRICARKEVKAGHRQREALPNTHHQQPAHPSHTPGRYVQMDCCPLGNLGTQRPPLEQRYLTANGHRKASAAEKQWRMDDARCVYCAAAENVFANCPVGNKTSHPQFTMRGAATNLQSNNPFNCPAHVAPPCPTLASSFGSCSVSYLSFN